MVEGLISVLVLLLVLVIVWYIVKIAVAQFGAPPAVLQIVGLILLLIFVVAMLSMLGFGHWPRWRVN
jgi:hypothetical protein